MDMIGCLNYLKLALPSSIDIKEIIALQPIAVWEEAPDRALAAALTKCVRIDWDAYLAENDDVCKAGMDPLLHFLKHGIYEGRKLHVVKLSHPEDEDTDISNDRLLDLVRQALPRDMSLQELLPYAPHELWIESPGKAVALALRNCRRINWEAYLARNEDVKAMDLDPCQHFLRHGIYEGRKLTSWHKLKEIAKDKAPLVSVVIINYNNAHLLSKCIESVLGQSLADMEIIIVDDCSTDNSLTLLEKYALQDNRIRVLVNEKNSATLITRKRGVEAATGRYVIFLDSDDYLESKACEIAVEHISRGYDIVKFGMNIVNTCNLPWNTINGADIAVNKGENREYFYDEIPAAMFRHRQISWHLCCNIFLREICVAAFGELPNERFTGPDDALATLAIVRRARSLLKIPDKLLNYNYGPGVTVTNDKGKILKYAFAVAHTTKFLRQYAEKCSLNIAVEKLYLDLCDYFISKLLPIARERDISREFSKIMDILGFESVLNILIHRHTPQQFPEIEAIARPLLPPPVTISHIGIFYPTLGHGGVEIVIQSFCALFIKDYKITIFAEQKVEDKLDFPPEVNIVYITPPWDDFSTLPERVLGLQKAALASGIDVMLHAATYLPYVFWDVFMLHHSRIPVIIFYHFNFALPFIRNYFDTRNREEPAFRCAAAITCLSVAEELYLRLHGANAIYMPNPVQQHTYEERAEVPQKIAVLGRLGAHVKQIGESLKILREVISQAPWISMILIGDFLNQDQEAEYRNAVREYGLEQHIALTGWTDDPGYFLKQCGVLLSVSLWESFAMNIVEAQALGLPCVIYDLAIEPAVDNPAIISVPQRDHLAAASEIISLLGDAQKWQRLSRIAVEKMKKYAPERFFHNMQNLLANFQRQAPLRKYSPQDYKTIIKYASFYSGCHLPDSWRG